MTVEREIIGIYFFYLKQYETSEAKIGGQKQKSDPYNEHYQNKNDCKGQYLQSFLQLARISRFVRNVCSSPDEHFIKTKTNIVVICHIHADVNM